jgi:hypothetical protein
MTIHRTAPLAAAAVTLAVLACGCRRSGKDLTAELPRDAKLWKDDVLAELLTPDARVVRQGVYIDARYQLYFAARLEQPPKGDFLTTYEDSLRSRGVFLQSQPGRGRWSWKGGHAWMMLRRDPEQPWSVLEREFVLTTGTGSWQRFFNLPRPLSLRGQILTVRLGNPQNWEWPSRQVLATEDRARVRELPFERFPGAFLTNDPTADGGETTTLRRYIVANHSYEEVVDHYAKTFAAAGLDARREGSELHGTGAAPGQGIERVELNPLPEPTFGRSFAQELPLAEVEHKAATVFGGLPRARAFYQITVQLTDASSAVRWSEDVSRSARVGLLGTGAEARLLRMMGHTVWPLDRGDPLDGLGAVVVGAGAVGDDDSNRRELHERLKTYVEGGGTLLVLVQSWDRDYAAIPTPHGEPLKVWGFRQDVSTYNDIVDIVTPHPVLASSSQARFAGDADGHLESFPSSGSVLLRRARDAMPVLVLYKLGKGRVFVSTSYAIEAKPQKRPMAAVWRDTLTWAIAPRPVAIVAPGRTASISARVRNVGRQTARKVRFLLLAPNRDELVAEEQRDLALEPEQVADATLTRTFRGGAQPGIYRIAYELLDAGGHVVQPRSPEDAAAVAVVVPRDAASPPPELTLTLNIPAGPETEREQPARIVYLLRNRTSRERRFRLYRGFNHRVPTFLREVTVAGRSEVHGEAAGIPPQRALGLWLHAFEAGASPPGWPAWLRMPPEERWPHRLSAGVTVRPKAP